MKPLYAIFMVMAWVVLVQSATASNITITAEPLGGTLNIVPGHPTSTTIDVSSLQRNAIQRITFDIPTGTTVDYTLWYGDGSSISGQMIYRSSSTGCVIPGQPFCQYSLVSMGSSSSDHYYIGAQEVGRIDIIGYGRDETDPANPVREFVIYDSSFGVHVPGDAIAYSPVPVGVIYKFQITSDKPLTGLAYYTNTKSNVVKASDSTLFDAISDWLKLFNQIKDSIIELFWFFYYVLEFVWDNWTMILALWLAITAAIAYNATSDFFKATARFFKYQMALYNFVLDMWVRLMSILSYLRSLI